MEIPVTITPLRFGRYRATCTYDEKTFRATAFSPNRARYYLREGILDYAKEKRKKAAPDPIRRESWAESIFIRDRELR